MAKVFLYVVDRDFGFAPNPFHGICSLATCKPRIRNSASIGDWVIGMGGRNLNSTGKCVFAMKVTSKITFNEYWENPIYKDKKPVRNGSKRMVVGDNIYHRDKVTGIWSQAFSHHSHSDGSLNEYNRDRDTKSSNVLLSKHFYYFGSAAPLLPHPILNSLNYKNGVGHKKYNISDANPLILWIESEYFNNLNLVMADPFNFEQSSAHYTVETNKVLL
ncbi:hypothetical protein IX39_20310 [Chryseobacterium formosense]|uniref:Nucleotide modification associated domain-containing protein n=1 Tax=Chryseobacterium formosense TaxID=236814 RepID=A0A085YYT0_9FLAO|nr:hypothetical protein [Chryseobacterium formosense]KFE97343.1 hypothetical protein IX39_20310 [Chryseobacterium formosense]SFT91198.1 hypothetical protein SAMN05421857_4075 [Chryseobacterium formosense]